MKKLLLITCFLAVLCFQGKAQFFDKKSSWTIITTNLFDDEFFTISTYKVKGDTLIEDKSYSKIFKDGNFHSALRETEDNKIYVYFPDFNRELLIYDFDWYPGKTLYCQTLYEDTNVVQAVLGSNIDSVQLLDGKYYKYVKNYFGEIGLIRGIGDTRGFFISTFVLPANGNQYALLCFYMDDELVYLNPKYSDCNGDLINSINVVTDNKSKVKLYPNPSNNNVTVEFQGNLNVDAFEIFDMKGSLIKTYKVCEKHKIEVQNLAKGTYVYSAILKNNRKLSGKIIIK